MTARRVRAQGARDLALDLKIVNERLRATVARAEANEVRYRALVDHLPDTVVYVYDRDHRITVASGAAIRARGFDAASLVGCRPDDVLTPADAALVHRSIDDAFAGRDVRAEVRLETTGIENLFDVVALKPPGGGEAQEVLLLARDVGPMKRRERELAVSEARWRAAFEDAPIGTAEIDYSGRILEANAALAALLEVSVQQLEGASVFGFLHPDERPDAAQRLATAAVGEISRGTHERQLLTATGRSVWVTVRRSTLAAGEGTPERLLVHFIDITAERESRRIVEATHARFAALVEHSSDAIVVEAADGRIGYASPGLAVMTGEPAGRAEGTRLQDRIHPEDRARVGVLMAGLAAAEGRTISFDCRLVRAAGGWRHVEVTATNRIADPATQGLVINLRDITERFEAAQLLAHQATHDTLTDLPNRTLLLDRLTQALARERRSGQQCAVLFLDLDRFKEINDTFGHGAGDELLQLVAQRLCEAVRPGDSVARLGGDEFVVLAENVRDFEAALEIAERVRTGLARPISLSGRTVTVSCSVGIAMSDAESPDTLLAAADTALYRAKEFGRDRCEVYNQAMRIRARRRFDVEDLIRAAVDGDQLVVVYQPIVDVPTDAVIGHEALARIRQPDGSLLEPDSFIGIAEESGLIGRLGAAVLAHACRQHSVWRASCAALSHIAVNISAKQLATPELLDDIRAVLAATGLPPPSLCLEITESSLIEIGSAAQQRIHDLKDLGVTLALDDFGTGWSSLSRLRHFPIDIVKIDRGFVRGLGTDREDTELVRAVIGLVQALHLITVAEGVETRLQSRMLKELGCSYAQGFLYGRPALPG